MSGLCSLMTPPAASRRLLPLLLLGAALVVLPAAAAAAPQEEPAAAEAQPAPAPPPPEVPEVPEIPEVPEVPEIPEIPEVPTRPSESQVIFGSPLTIEEHEVVKDVAVFGAPLTVRGRVIGDAAAFGGPVTVSGEVTGDVVSIGGPVTLEATAEVMGDVVSIGGALNRHPDARVLGSVVDSTTSFRFGDWSGVGNWPWGSRHVEFGFSPWSAVVAVSWKVFGLLLLTLLLCLILLLAGRPVERIERRITAEPWKCGLVGLLAQILFLPALFLVIVVLAVSVVGIPFCLLIPFALLALLILSLVGYTAVSYRVGEVVRGRFDWKIASPFLVLILGLVTLHVWGVIGQALDLGWGPLRLFAVMFYFVGCMLVYIAFTVGVGGMLLTRFGTAEGWGEARALPPPPPGGDAAAAYPEAPEPEAAPEPQRSDWDT